MLNILSKASSSMLLISAFFSVMGCGDGKPTRVPVSGTVLIDGKPLASGAIQFVPEGARSSGSVIDNQGHFILSCYAPGDGAVLGKHKVRVTAAQSVSEKQLRWEAPKKYSIIGTSGLEFTVDGPTDKAEINLTWAGGKPFVETFK
jgi:hypothetical protein